MAIKQRTGHSRRRLRVRPARVPLLAAPATRRAAARPRSVARAVRCRSTPGSSSSCACCARTARVSRHTAYRGVFQLMLTTTKVAQLLRLTLATRPALRARDQRQQVRAEHPLHRRVGHGPRRGVRPRRRLRADVLQPVMAADARGVPLRRRLLLLVAAAVLPPAAMAALGLRPDARGGPFARHDVSIGLPGMDGYALCRPARARRTRPSARHAHRRPARGVARALDAGLDLRLT